MDYGKKEREAYNLHREMVCKTLGITVNQYNWLRRKGEAMRRIYTDHCNGVICDTIITKHIENKIYAYLNKKKLNNKEHKMYIYFQTDPRGATIYADNKPIPENNYNQAYCIY
jgi:hypothetical protein